MRLKRAVLNGFVIFMAFFLHCADPMGGTDTGNPTVVGVIYKSDGSRAKHAKVQIVPADYNPRSGTSSTAYRDSTNTDDTGGYYFDSLPSAIYNVFGNGDDGVSYQDSIVIVKGVKTAIPSDTLKAPGTLQGIIRLQPGDDPRTVFILLLGTTIFTMPDDSLGNFRLFNLAEGSYRLRIVSSLDQYAPKDTAIVISAGKTIVLSNSVSPKYTGIPIPTGLTLIYDTVRQVVTLSWDKADPLLSKGYITYRKNVAMNSIFERISAYLIVDTIFRDSFLEINTTYEYKICAVDSNDNPGKLSAGVRVTTAALPNSPPVITRDPADTAVFVGSFVRFSITTIGSGSMIYSWYKGSLGAGNLISGSDSSVFSMNAVQFADSGYYYCIVRNDYGADTSSAAYLSVLESSDVPIITMQPRDTAVKENQPFSLSVAVTGKTPLNYKWYIGSTAVGTTNPYGVAAARLTDVGTYYCIVANSFGSCTSRTAIVTVLPNKSVNNPIMVSGLFVDSTHVLLSVMKYSGLLTSTPDQFFTWSPDTVMIWCSSAGFPAEVNAQAATIKVSRTRLRTAGGDQFDTIITVPPIGCNAYYFMGSVKWTSTTQPPAKDSIPRFGDSLSGAKVYMCETLRPVNTLSLNAININATQVVLGWTNSGIPYDSVRIWYSVVQVPDSNISPTLYSQAKIGGTLTSTVIGNLKELTTYYFGIQGSRQGLWSNIPPTAKISATTPKDSTLTIPNTMKIIDVAYDTVSFKLRITYRLDPLGFQHRIGFTWLQRDSIPRPLPSEFLVEPSPASPREGVIDYTDQLGKILTCEFSLDFSLPVLEFGKSYYFAGWVSKVAEKWSQPTDSSIYYYAIPQPKTVLVRLFPSATDIVTAFGNQVVLRKVDPIDLQAKLHLTEDFPVDGSGLHQMSIGFWFELSSKASVRLLVGLYYKPELLPPAVTVSDIRMYRYDTIQQVWSMDTSSIILDPEGKPVFYVQKYLPECNYPFMLAVPDSAISQYRQECGEIPAITRKHNEKK